MKSLVLLQNKDERAMCRLELASSFSATMYGQLREGLEEIEKAKGAFEFLVLDERLDYASERNGEPLTILDLLEAFNRAPARPANAVVLIVLNESSTADGPIRYLESGVDMFLRRPVAVQDLREKIKEAASWVVSPPPAVHLQRFFHEAVSKERYSEVLAGLESFFAKNPQNIRIGSLLAKTLLRQGAETRARGIEVAKSLDERFPDSLFAKRLLIEGFLAEKKTEAAYGEAIRLFDTSPGIESFEQAFGLADRLGAESAKDPQIWLRLLESLRKQDAARTRERRLRIIRHGTGLDPSLDAVRAFVNFLTQPDQADILEAGKESVETWVRKLHDIRSRIDGHDPSLDELYGKTLALLLDVDPGAPSAIEAYTDLQLRRNEPKLAEKYLKRAKDKNRFSVEFYSAFAKLSLAQDMLKEASDMIHAGRRLAPSDDRWNELSKVWSDKYAKKQ